ncbi:MAG: M60 family metallopeptidase [Ruminococcus sp.]|nr:M60 family metallopeptidase [Ruminococcus sp.]
MKKILAFVSALSMFGSLSQAVGVSEILSYNIISAAAEEGESEETTTNAPETTTGESGETTGESGKTMASNQQETGDNGSSLLTYEKIDNDGKFSKIKVEISNQMDIAFENPIDCTVKIIDQEGKDILGTKEAPAIVTVGKNKNDSNSIITEDYIPNGGYIVRVEAPGFKAFEQEITNVQNVVCTVKVTLGFQNGYSYTYTDMKDNNGNVITNPDGDVLREERKNNGEHPGVLVHGDINGSDGDENHKAIDMTDATELAKAIDFHLRLSKEIDADIQKAASLKSEYEALKNKEDADEEEIAAAKQAMEEAVAKVEEKQSPYPVSKYDLNNDGEVNMSDLGYITKSLIDTKDWETDATLETEISERYSAFVLQEAVQPMEGTKVSDEGCSLEDLINRSSANKSESGEDGEGVKDSENKTMQLVPEGGVIDDEHPVGFDMSVADGVKGFDFETDGVEAGFIEYVDVDGTNIDIPFSIGEDYLPAFMFDLATGEFTGKESSIEASISSDGTISVNLGGQTAVKKIKLKITKTKNANLAEIAEVKILNDLETRIPEPEIDYPTEFYLEQDMSRSDLEAKINLAWKPLVNAGLYEYEVSTNPSTKADGSFGSTIAKKQMTADETEKSTGKYKDGYVGFSLYSQDLDYLIKTNTTYYLHVRCVSEDGSYASKWSDVHSVSTVPTSAPEKVDYLSVKGGTKALYISWGACKTNSATSYKLYYAKKSEVNEKGYTCIPLGKTTSYTLVGLEDKTEYNVYVAGCNEKYGEGARSDIKSGATIVTIPVQMHKYGAINIDDEGKLGSTHITDVYRAGNGGTVGNKVDEENAKKVAAKETGAKLTTWATVDGDMGSYYTKQFGTGDPHNNGGYHGPNNDSIIYEFDAEYEIGSVGVAYPYTNKKILYTSVDYWDENGKKGTIGSHYDSTLYYDVNGNGYYVVKLPRKINAKKIRIGFDTGNNGSHISVAEMAFYKYDPIRDEIMGLYTDDFHLVLRDDVTQKTIDDLRNRIETSDGWGEPHPERDSLIRELDAAEKILKNSGYLNPPVIIHNEITTHEYSGSYSRNFQGLNAWQPLGVTAGAGTEITVYVGSPHGNMKNIGTVTELKLVATQYHAESNGVTILDENNSQFLKIGENKIRIPSTDSGEAEGGGSLYISNKSGIDSAIVYAVRVSGGSPISVLDLYNVKDDNERFNKAADYIEALERQVDGLEAEHEYAHANAKLPNTDVPNTKIALEYDKKNCIAGATEILCDKMMYSLPADQILAGLGPRTASVESRAEKLLQSLDAMENMMNLFYQHKGIVNSTHKDSNQANMVHRIPDKHLNIRYQRMFTGAFMYAAGNHIGIEWGSASGMVNCPGVSSDENGKYEGGSYFGWGIAHEIGHDINDSNYVHAEVTNNYFALLAQAQDKNEGSRLNYNNIFKKVSSGSKGKADNGVQLGMYWQLHLAYDKDYNYKTYNTNEEILKNLFYARVDTYSRQPSRAPSPYGIPLTLSGDSEQKLMRLACAAAEKNVLEFFERWGMTPDETTRNYAQQFSKEKRAIMYANEDSRVYAMNGESLFTVDENGNPDSIVIENVDVKVGEGDKANKVTLSIDIIDAMPKEEILGYEIMRRTISKGDLIETPITFTKDTTFVDTVTAYNNRTVSYRVTVIDQYLNRSYSYITDTVKIHHDGSLDKSHWSVSTSNLATEAVYNDITDGLACSHTLVDLSAAVIDNSLTSCYEPTVSSNKAEIILNFNQSLVVTGMKYTAGNKDNKTGNYKIYVMNETGNGWIQVSSGTFAGDETVYFSNADGKYISTYDTTAVKLEILNQNGKKISIAELDVLGVTGDNVDFRTAKDGEKAEAAFGILTEDYKYGKDDEDYIPEGSLVFTGAYKGSPSYNAVILFDEKGEIVGSTGVDDEGESNQIILADIPSSGEISDVSNGTWIYWIEPDKLDAMYWPEKVRAELYRVNDIKLNTGQRIVSDSLFEKLESRSKIAPISFSGGHIPGITTQPATESTTAESTTTETVTTTADTE